MLSFDKKNNDSGAIFNFNMIQCQLKNIYKLQNFCC